METTIEPTPIEIGMKWQAFREIAFSFQRPETELAYEALQFVVEAEWSLSFDSIGMVCTVRVKPDEKTDPFLTITTETLLAMQGLSDVAELLTSTHPHAAQIPIPMPLLVSIAGIGLSTTRGVLWEKSKTLDLPGLDRLLIPTINTEALLPKPETITPL